MTSGFREYRQQLLELAVAIENLYVEIVWKKQLFLLQEEQSEAQELGEPAAQVEPSRSIGP